MKNWHSSSRHTQPPIDIPLSSRTNSSFVPSNPTSEPGSEPSSYSSEASDRLPAGSEYASAQTSLRPGSSSVPYDLRYEAQHVTTDNISFEPIPHRSRDPLAVPAKLNPHRTSRGDAHRKTEGNLDYIAQKAAQKVSLNRPGPSRQQQKAPPPMAETDSNSEEEEEDNDDMEASIDVDELNPRDVPTLPPNTRKVIYKAAEQYRTRSSQDITKNARSQYGRDGPGQPNPRTSDPTVYQTYPPEVESINYCCRKSQLLARQNQAGIDYCPGCQAIFCDRHWKQQIPHRNRGSPGHEKTSPTVARWVSATLEASLGDEEQAIQHLIDNNSALWFGAGPDDRGSAVFRDFGRYGSLMSEQEGSQRVRKFPAFAAFVGETGAGKSSLIKLMISMFGKSTSPHQTPVVGSTVNEDIPTSGDVHLYCDPNTFHSSDPILYADCEGLNGGTRDPIAAKYRRRRSTHHDARQTQTPGLRTALRQALSSSEREIIWANTPETSTREYFVRHLYPRLLYTFSDVIVFVVKNVRAIENVIEQLITWADAVFEASSNQPVLPHAIIVLNASDNRDPALWDVNNSTVDLLKKVEEAIKTNAQLKKYIQNWRRRGVNISSMEQLLLSYYSRVRVIRVPTRDRPKLIHEQVKKLYEEIKESATASLEFKLSVRVKLSSEELQPYLHNAFDHFCRTLKSPFDFVQASRANCTIPSDFGGNILKLALSIMERWANRLDGPLLFKELSFIVASCAMLDAVRRGILGLAEGMFPQYIAHFDEALEDFCDRYWPCEYVCIGGRCVNVRAGHSKGHQMASAQIVEPNAPYQSTFTASSYRSQFLADTFGRLEELLSKLGVMKKERDLEEKEAAVEIHRDSVIKHFYRHLGGADKFSSHSTCLACLVFAPQHHLPCGHILCTPCIEAFGRKRGYSAIELSCCPLHDSAVFYPRWTITLQPETAGVRILTLDGGGIRGVVELVTLQHIERELGGLLRVQSFFDLIVGTSTGGIIALGIGEKNWSIDDCLGKFMTLASTVFSRKWRFRLASADKIFTMLQHGKYDTVALENVLMGQFGQDRLFGGLKEQMSNSRIPRPKVAITATSINGIPYVLGNYNRQEPSDSSMYEFLRAERSEQEMKVYEVARATSAAPKIFKPYEHPTTKLSFMDGGIYHNNPIEVAMQELKLSFPEIGERPPDILVSIGTGIGSDKTKRNTVLESITPKGPLSYHKHLIKIATDHVRHSLDSEKTWEKFISQQNNDIKYRWCRLNFRLDEKCPKLDDVSKMHHLKDTVDAMLKKRQAEIRNIADRLIASSFYFRPSYKPKMLPKGYMVLEGTIECRFPSESDEIRCLGDYLLRKRSLLYNSFGAKEGPSFVFQERRREKDAKQILIPTETMTIMKNRGTFSMREQRFAISNPLALVDLYFAFGDESYEQQHNSISGFPRCWDIDDRPILRPSLSLSRKRAPELHMERPEWSKPSGSLPEALETYANNDLPGLATQSDIYKVSQRLTEPADTGLEIMPRSIPPPPNATSQKRSNFLLKKKARQTYSFEPSSASDTDFNEDYHPVHEMDAGGYYAPKNVPDYEVTGYADTSTRISEKGSYTYQNPRTSTNLTQSLQVPGISYGSVSPLGTYSETPLPVSGISPLALADTPAPSSISAASSSAGYPKSPANQATVAVAELEASTKTLRFEMPDTSIPSPTQRQRPFDSLGDHFMCPPDLDGRFSLPRTNTEETSDLYDG